MNAYIVSFSFNPIDRGGLHQHGPFVRADHQVFKSRFFPYLLDRPTNSLQVLGSDFCCALGSGLLNHDFYFCRGVTRYFGDDTCWRGPVPVLGSCDRHAIAMDSGSSPVSRILYLGVIAVRCLQALPMALSGIPANLDFRNSRP